MDHVSAILFAFIVSGVLQNAEAADCSRVNVSAAGVCPPGEVLASSDTVAQCLPTLCALITAGSNASYADPTMVVVGGNDCGPAQRYSDTDEFAICEPLPDTSVSSTASWVFIVVCCSGLVLAVCVFYLALFGVKHFFGPSSEHYPFLRG